MVVYLYYASLDPNEFIDQSKQGNDNSMFILQSLS